MRAIWELFAGGFRRYSRYRAAILASLLTNTGFGLIRASLLLTALSVAGQPIGGYDRVQAATYVWLGQGLLGAIPLWAVSEISQRVRTGDIVIDLLRPIPPLAQWWATDLGRAASQLGPRFVPMLFIGWLVTGLSLPAHPLPYLLFVVSLVLAVSLSFLGWVIVNLLALWVIEVRGFLNLYMIVLGLLTGLYVPVSWFPGWLRTLAYATPFPSMFQTPINVFMGAEVGGSLAQQIGVQALWLAVLAAGAQLMISRGTRRVVVQGG